MFPPVDSEIVNGVFFFHAASVTELHKVRPVRRYYTSVAPSSVFIQGEAGIVIDFSEISPGLYEVIEMFTEDIPGLYNFVPTPYSVGLGTQQVMGAGYDNTQLILAEILADPDKETSAAWAADNFSVYVPVKELIVLKDTNSTLKLNDLIITSNATIGSGLTNTLTKNARQRETYNYDVITANDTINNTTINITPTSNDVTNQVLRYNNYDVTINKNVTNRWYNSVTCSRFAFTNYNDSTNTVQPNYNYSRNLQGYVNSFNGFMSQLQTLPTNTRAKTNNMYDYNASMAAGCATGTSGEAIVGQMTFGKSIMTLGSYHTTTIDSAKGIDLSQIINARTAGKTTSINTLKGYNLDISSTFTTGTRSVQNLYGLYMQNRSGVSGSLNDYGIYVTGFRNNYLEQLTIRDSLFVGTDTITGSIYLADIGNIDLSNEANPLNTIYLKELSIEEGADATMGVSTLVGGTITVNTTAVIANSRIFLTLQDCTNCGYLYVTNKVGGVSFDIQSSNVLDESNVAWIIIKPN